MSATCPGCGQPIYDEQLAQTDVCWHCGHTLKSSSLPTDAESSNDEFNQPRRPLLQQRNRGLLWLVFWFLFLGAPFAPFINEVMSKSPHIRLNFISPVITIIAAIAGGALGAGFVLARLYSRSTSQLILRGVFFGIGIVLFYAVVAYAGCLLILS